MRITCVPVAVVALAAACGPSETGSRMQAMPDGGAAPAAEPIGDPQEEAMACEDWPDCPPGIYADSRNARAHYGCGETVIRSDTGERIGVQGQRGCSTCYVGSPQPATCNPEFIGRCKAPAYGGSAEQCSTTVDVVHRPNGDVWMVNCTGKEMIEVICWDRTPEAG